jgi:HK97 family phage major capsid protein
MELKTPGTMLLDGSLTGDGVASYSATQAILPAQKVNFRDLLPTSISPTGLYVQYREGAADGSVGVQNEGSPKSQIQYTFSEIKVVEDYIAGFARFSKQMAKQLPYMQGTLPRLLTRDFYSAENANFWSTVTVAADGNNTSTGADYVEVIMELIGNQQAANFNASVVIVNPATLAKINKNLLTKGYYPGAAGVNSLASGALTISGTPVVGASFAAAETALIIDRDYLERVETESINIEFAMEDADNFTKNLITARIECQEAINLMLPTSAIFFDFS